MWRNERLGLIVVFSSLAVIVIIIALLFSAQRTAEEQQIRTHVGSLVQMMGKMSWDQLVSDKSSRDILSVLHYSRGSSRYAYSAVVDAEGLVHRNMVVPGVVVPSSANVLEPSSWMGEREVKAQDGKQSFLEFHAPVMSSGELKGYVRLGYFKPGYGLGYKQLPFLATLALPIFLLVPLFYFLLRLEVRPLQQVNSKMEQLIEQSANQKLELHANGEVGDFLERFNRFIELTVNKSRDLESERNDLFASSKLLAYQQDKLETLMQTIPDAILVLDMLGVPSYANTKINALLGVTSEQIVGQRLRDWCKIPEVMNYLSRYENKSYQGYAGESITFNPQDNASKTLKLNAYPLFSPKHDSKLIGTLVVIRDITEEHMIRTSRGEFVAQVAHELKTPLNVLSMYSESLMGDDGASEEMRVEGLNIIHDQVERLSNLINNLLAITKFEMDGMKVNKQRVRIHELLEDALDSISKSGRGRDLEFIKDIPREVSAIYADKELLSIAINNLLTNAIKYNKPGGQVILRVEETDEHVQISVRDTGIGISPEDQHQVFDKFFRSNDDNVREQTGHGLGLPLVNQIVNLHHGYMDLKSQLGEGSEFIIKLDKDSNILQQAMSA
ncbi:MAG: PAS domain S-box protein [Gammaproteobacteria bacterium]|nr:PAS domain S-box protein [Gammaproteobacteria bacterium]